MKKLNEDDIIVSLMAYLENQGWHIDSYSLGHKQKKGNDITASREGAKLIVEANGARSLTREYFDRVQVKSYFARALIRVLDDKALNPKIQFAIAHPDENQIRKAIGHLVPFLKQLGIIHYWVSAEGIIEEV